MRVAESEGETVRGKEDIKQKSDVRDDVFGIM